MTWEYLLSKVKYVADHKSSKDEFLKMENKSYDFSKDMSQSSNTINRVTCIAAVTLHLKFTFLGDKIFSIRERTTHSKIGERRWCMFSSILNGTKSAEKSADGPSKNQHVPTWQWTILIPTIAKVIKTIIISDF